MLLLLFLIIHQAVRICEGLIRVVEQIEAAAVIVRCIHSVHISGWHLRSLLKRCNVLGWRQRLQTAQMSIPGLSLRAGRQGRRTRMHRDVRGLSLVRGDWHSTPRVTVEIVATDSHSRHQSRSLKAKIEEQTR